jgi:anthranilate phosphoribosyltransferase
LAHVLKNLGCEEALVVHGMDGLDEISLCDKTKVTHLKNGKIENYFIAPEEFGLRRAKKEDLLGGGAAENAAIALEIIKDKTKGPKRDVVLLNAAAAIYVAGKAKDIKEGMKLAAESIDQGLAQEKLERLRHCQD